MLLFVYVSGGDCTIAAPIAKVPKGSRQTSVRDSILAPTKDCQWWWYVGKYCFLWWFRGSTYKRRLQSWWGHTEEWRTCVNHWRRDRMQAECCTIFSHNAPDWILEILFRSSQWNSSTGACCPVFWSWITLNNWTHWQRCSRTLIIAVYVVFGIGGYLPLCSCETAARECLRRCHGIGRACCF